MVYQHLVYMCWDWLIPFQPIRLGFIEGTPATLHLLPYRVATQNGLDTVEHEAIIPMPCPVWSTIRF